MSQDQEIIVDFNLREIKSNVVSEVKPKPKRAIKNKIIL